MLLPLFLLLRRYNPSFCSAILKKIGPRMSITPSNFRTATLKERLPVPVVAVAVFSDSVSSSTEG
jgi:hypothetical protein